MRPRKATAMAPAHNGHGSKVVYTAQPSSALERSASIWAIAFSSAWASHDPASWPRGGSVASKMRLRASAAITFFGSTTTAPTGTVRATYAAHAWRKAQHQRSGSRRHPSSPSMCSLLSALVKKDPNVHGERPGRAHSDQRGAPMWRYASLAAPVLPQLSSLRMLAYTVIQSFH